MNSKITGSLGPASTNKYFLNLCITILAVQAGATMSMLQAPVLEYASCGRGCTKIVYKN